MKETTPFKRPVYALGETVLDLVSNRSNGNNYGENGFTMHAIPGGSVLNASVSLGRMGTEIQLITEFGDDKAGDLIAEFLHTNSVNTDYCTRHLNYRTSLALAFLDNAKNASYSFYHDTPASLDDNRVPDFSRNDILLFGSYYAVKTDRREFVLNVLHKAVEAKSTIYYDLNIRKAHTAELEMLMPYYMNNISVATIVKGSDEDFKNIFGISDPAAVYEKIRQYCTFLIITSGSKPLHVFTPGFTKMYQVSEISPVSTIGAGDNFNAGFIYGLSTTGFDSKQLKSLSVQEMDRIVGCGLAFATETCLSEANYIPARFGPGFWKQYI